MRDRRTACRRALLSIAAAVVVTTTAGLGSAAAEPVMPPPAANAHFVAPGRPVFFEADGLTGAKYHSVSAAERLSVTCRNLVTIGAGPIKRWVRPPHLRRSAYSADRAGTRVRAGRLGRAPRARGQHQTLLNVKN